MNDMLMVSIVLVLSTLHCVDSFVRTEAASKIGNAPIVVAPKMQSRSFLSAIENVVETRDVVVTTREAKSTKLFVFLFNLSQQIN